MNLADYPAIELSEVQVRVGGHSILHAEEFIVPNGKIVAVIGPNGAGKSTLLRVCAGVQPLNRGIVRIAGQSPRHPQSRRRLAYVPQALAVAGELPITVREVVTIGRTGLRGLFHRLRTEDHLKVENWIGRLGLSDVADYPYAETSGGQQRKTLLARAMVQEPAILLLDEPTVNLDAGAREIVVQALEQLHEGLHLTILLACHDLETIPASCDRVIILNDGRIVADGLPTLELTRRRVSALYGGDLSVIRKAGRHALVPASIAEPAGDAYGV